MAAPQYGRVFLRSHGDCFIHATPYFVKYWNFSLTKEGLGIVKVTVVHPKERVFLSCISPTPLSYDNIQRGVHHRKYLEMDPKFAAELDITTDTEVVLESVRNIEKCLKLKLAPKDPRDFEILMNNFEKITFELAEKIRVISCQTFFNFPVWINTNTVPIRIISSEPSANWVLIHPNSTVLELCQGINSDGEVSVTPNTTVTTISSPELSGEEVDEETSSSKDIPYINYCPNYPLSSSTNSGGSSVDTELAGANENWGIHSILQMGKKFFNFQNSTSRELPEDYWKEEEEDDEEVAVLPMIRKEPIRYSSDNNFDDLQLVQDGLAKKDMIHSELKNKFKVNDSLCVRSANSTPEPRPSLSSGSEESIKHSHKRTATWHSETEFSPSRSTHGLMQSWSTMHMQNNKLSAYINTPRMDANLRVQPHAITGLRQSYGKFTSDEELWCLENIFDVYVHPSTLPEVYHYLQEMTPNSAFLVEIVPIQQMNKYVPKNTETLVKLDSLSDLGDQSEAKDVMSKPESSLASSLVVRLCFATEVIVEESYMCGKVSGIHPVGTEEGELGEGRGTTSILLEVPVKVGHVVMSDLVRQQLEIKQCSRVRLLHIEDCWKMAFADGIKIVIHPIYCSKMENLKLLLESFREWILKVSTVSKFGGVLVNKQLLPLKMDKHWVNCWLSVGTGRLVKNHNVRTSYCLLKPSDFERHQITVLLDPFSRSGVRRHNYQRRLHNTKNSGNFRKDEEPVSEEGMIKLMDMRLLNQLPTKAHREHFGALNSLLDKAMAHLRTVFAGRKRCSTVLVCGKSGSAGVGCGKSSLLKLIAREAMAWPYLAYVSLVDCTSMRSQTTQRTKKRLVSLFSQAIQNQPSLLLLDDLDHAMPLVSDAQEVVREEGMNSISKTQILRDLLYISRKKGAQMLIVATAQNQHQINKELLTSQGRQTFDMILEIQPPSLSDREEIITALMRSIKLSLKDCDVKTVASKTEGFQAGDLVTVVDRAISYSELRILCPTSTNPFSRVRNILCQSMSMDSCSDLDSGLELSSLPQTTHSLATSLELDLPQAGSGSAISSSHHIKRKKKISIMSASSLTPGTPASSGSFEMFHRPTPLKVKAVSLSQVDLTIHDFESALKGFVPLSLRGLALHTSGMVDFSHIGGMEPIKQALKETLHWPIKYPELFRQCPIKQCCGVLLYGAPGTGKTLLAGAVAKEFGLNFISVKGPELLSKYIGASEKAVRDIFTRAQSARPCILFFDEFDSLAPKRGHDNTGVTDRVVNQLLTQLDGVEVLEGVYVMAASSRPDLIDPALLRPGRIDMKLFCSMPDESERYEILKTLSKDVMTSVEVNLKELAQPCYTENFTGADLKALLFNAQLKAAHAVLDQRMTQTKMDSAPSSPLSLESSPESSNKRSSSNGLVSFTYHPSFGARRHSVVPEDIEEKVEAIIGRERSSFASSDRQSRVSRGEREVLLTQDILLSAIHDTRASVSEAERLKYCRIYDKFTGKAEPTLLQNLKPLVTLA